MRILDVGAEINPFGARGVQLIDAYPWKNNLTAVNLSADDIRAIKKHYPQVNAVIADACRLPWPDKYFDIVYSNAVIEHIGDYDRQRQMANEIMRVGKRWFVATPNRWFPFEFHIRLPFITWLPGSVYLWIGRIVRYNHVRKKYMFGIKCDGIRLLSARQLSRIFPGSEIIKQRITFMPETLIAVGPDVEL